MAGLRSLGGGVKSTDPEMFADAHVSHFGALKTSSVIPVLKGNFPGSELDDVIWTETSSNGGSVTVGSGVANLATSTNTAGSAKLLSKDVGRFEAGQVTVYQSGVRAGVGVADNTRRWGLMTPDEQNGLFFELDGTTFQVVARKAGTDTAVASTAFNVDTEFTPADTNNTYRIFYSAGRAIFCAARQGKLRTLHRMVDSALPLVDDLDMGLFYENTNDGNATNVEMRVRGASSSVFGDLRRFNDGGALLTADFETEVALGKVSRYKSIVKFGRVTDVSAASNGVDVWGGGNGGTPLYTGHPTDTTPEPIEVLSTSSADGAGLSGAHTVRFSGLTSAGATKYTDNTVTLNGTTPVTAADSFYRVNRAVVVSAGSGGENDGTIIIRHAQTSANVFARLPVGLNQTQIAAWTVPGSATAVIKRFRAAITRNNGSAGSAHITLRARPPGGVFNAIRAFEVQTGAPTEFTNLGGDVLAAGTDVKIRVEDVSDANTQVDGALEIIYIED